MGKKKHAEHVNHERWLVSWADLLTLLFAFFVVMFASSVSDKKKSSKMAAAMQTAFQQKAIFDSHAATPPLAPGAGTSSGDPMPLELPIETALVSTERSDGDAEKRAIEASIAPALQQHLVKMRDAEDGITLSLDSAGFFDSGSAEVKPSVQPILNKLAASLPRRALRVEGHTDNRPIHTAQFRSNWELSTARAAAIAEVLMRCSLISPADFAIAGYAEFHPIAGNNTESGRAANRRVDIVLLRNQRTTSTQKTSARSFESLPPQKLRRCRLRGRPGCWLHILTCRASTCDAITLQTLRCGSSGDSRRTRRCR
ncbi:flagellar motor protein [Terriglobus roseus DSM 18391]|uniref:Flagellar motor protein n=1 Tax=Terriglobus roseus (strain DSM 18391 / NRRL B-41598 / KBS 63) TaxID=926566 RepID=I3ZHU7_TERRK|nr:flagellar motor protein MotB [Terriglobus roseus]AFL88474.1 flagellar motor protein [Terriglobus roseus DSM 18391]AFL88815.1 flagellar motor protein [Terriglobus roseus DSM 18391]